jgi:hypothetical protein
LGHEPLIDAGDYGILSWVQKHIYKDLKDKRNGEVCILNDEVCLRDVYFDLFQFYLNYFLSLSIGLHED